MRSALRRAPDDLRHAHWRLSTKLMVGLLVFAMGAIFFLTKRSEIRSTEVLTAAESRLLTSLAGSVALQVGGDLMQYRRAAVQVATDPEVVAYLTAAPSVQASRSSALLTRLTSALGVDPDFRQLIVMDATGDVVISSGATVRGQDLSASAFFRGGSAAAADPYLSDFTRSEDGRSQVIYAALPIREPTGKVLGVAAVRLSPDHLTARLRSKDLSDRGSHGILVSRPGIVLANPARPASNYKSLRALGLTQLADQLAGARAPGFAAASLLGSSETDVIGFAPIGAQGWTVLVAEAQSVYTADVSSLARTQSLNALVLALIIGGMVVFLTRLFESKERESLADPLTRLANRRLLEEMLRRELRRAHRSGLPVSLVFVDIDHFKQVNDSLGHRVGDEVLQQLARVMLSSVRAADMVVRYGGEEFVILLPETGREAALQVAGKLRQAVADTLIRSTSRPGTSLRCTVSAGVAAYPLDCNSGEELILKADQALYHAKQNGRNRVITVGEVEAAEDATAQSAGQPGPLATESRRRPGSGAGPAPAAP